ncbi:MAG: hypothetical protein DMF93_01390 [Acidobacteria bacterium]|nr:MAG: hypothetical protein DMF93_01390 [Acidobacteriota bacterium]
MFDPLKRSYSRRPANTPSVTPGKEISRRAPLVFTSHEVTWKLAAARVISSGVRGNPFCLKSPFIGGIEVACVGGRLPLPST